MQSWMWIGECSALDKTHVDDVGLDGLLHRLLDGLLLGHLGCRTLLVEGGTRGLSWGGGDRSGLVPTGLDRDMTGNNQREVSMWWK
jgi:hypothetical protein